MRLTEKERRFVDAYVGEARGNGSQAAITAGYAKPSATVTASRLLRKANVAEALATRRTALAEKADVTAERITQELARIGFADIRQIFDDKGNLKAVHELSDEAAAAIIGVEVSREKRRDVESGTVVVEDSIVKVKSADKIGALALLCRTLGMLKDKVEHDHKFSLELVLDASRVDGR